MAAGRGNELPEADRVCRGVGQWIVSTFDHRQQRQLHRHVALGQALDDVVDIRRAAFADGIDVFWVAGIPQAHTFDARVDADFILQLETIAYAFPDIGVFARLDLVVEPLRLALQAHGSRGISRTVRSIAGQALTAGQDHAAHHRERSEASRQRLYIQWLA